MNEKNLERRSEMDKFLLEHMELCIESFNKREGYKNSSSKSLIRLARDRLFYSNKTVSQDIYDGLYNKYWDLIYRIRK